ncbi:MAG: ATP-binding protein [Spirochaetaceae bacterium]|jgi:hypothetical protein|nr:ATP-binding protein [Spirochaetaceae bacterium]GMO28189.1 MAG: hypothetical protein Pg6A_16010 [Termitinemataceae bacterium]
MFVTLSDIACDIAKNACESGADTVELEVMEIGRDFRFIVRDNGKGMSGEETGRALDPLNSVDFPGTSKTGLGIPLLIRTVNDAAGGWDLHTEKGVGTTISVWFNNENPETPPVGDLATMFCDAMAMPGPREFVVRRVRKTGANDVRYELRKTELQSALGGLNDSPSLTLLSTYLQSLENPPAVYGGGFD